MPLVRDEYTLPQKELHMRFLVGLTLLALSCKLLAERKEFKYLLLGFRI